MTLIRPNALLLVARRSLLTSRNLFKNHPIVHLVKDGLLMQPVLVVVSHGEAVRGRLFVATHLYVLLYRSTLVIGNVVEVVDNFRMFFARVVVNGRLVELLYSARVCCEIELSCHMLGFLFYHR